MLSFFSFHGFTKSNPGPWKLSRRDTPRDTLKVLPTPITLCLTDGLLEKVSPLNYLDLFKVMFYFLPWKNVSPQYFVFQDPY